MNDAAVRPGAWTPRVALCAVLRDERRYILEWIAHHRLLGVQRFLIFDNESRDGSGLLLAALQARGLVDVVTWPGRRLETQVRAFQAAANALAFKCDFVAFIDLDEFLMTDGAETLPGALRATPADVGALAICQQIFGSGGRLDFTPDLVSARFTTRAPDDRDEHRWVKTIARPECVRHFISPHSVALSRGRYVMTDGGPFMAGAHAGAADRIRHGRIRLHHHMLKSRAEFDAKRRRGAFLDAQDVSGMDERYFLARDPECNALSDLSGLNRAAAVRAEIGRMIEGFAPDLRRMAYEDLRL